MLMLRLQRMGKKKHASYRLIVSDKRRDPQATHLELLGVYHPTEKNSPVNFRADRITHWLSVGAQASATVHNLLVSNGIIQGKKRRVVAKTKKIDPAKAEVAPASTA